MTVALFWPTVMAALLTATLTSASADTELRGVPDAMYLRAENATVTEVLAALSAQFNLRYSPGPSLDRTVTGIYSGTLRHVLTRILDGSNYVIKFSADDIEIKILGNPSAIHPSSAVAVNQKPIASSKITENSVSVPSQIAPLVPK